MPNWCYNTMVAIGGKRELTRLQKAITVGQHEYSLNHLVPLDPRTSVHQRIPYTDERTGETRYNEFTTYATTEEHGFDGYTHTVDKWGSKWGACSVELSTPEPVREGADKAHYLRVYYESAWSPCDGLITELSKQFPSLVFAVSSTEEAHDFVVWLVVNNGERIEQGDCLDAQLPLELRDLRNRAEDALASGHHDADRFSEEYYEAYTDWYHILSDRAFDESVTIAKEYLAHLAYEKRVIQRGGTPRTFIPSV